MPKKSGEMVTLGNVTSGESFETIKTPIAALLAGHTPSQVDKLIAEFRDFAHEQDMASDVGFKSEPNGDESRPYSEKHDELPQRQPNNNQRHDSKEALHTDVESDKKPEPLMKHNQFPLSDTRDFLDYGYGVPNHY